MPNLQLKVGVLLSRNLGLGKRLYNVQVISNAYYDIAKGVRFSRRHTQKSKGKDPSISTVEVKSFVAKQLNRDR